MLKKIKKGLIGSTGLIGKNLQKNTIFQKKYNSKNISKIKKNRFDLLVCAGAPGSMLLANQNPKKDSISINSLIKNLNKADVNQFILISTIQVFTNISHKNFENSKKLNNALTYGRNRRKLEKFCEKKFKKCLIIRLPSVFGSFLVKNFIFDISNPMPNKLTNIKMSEIKSKINVELYKEISKIYTRKNNFYNFNNKKFIISKFKKKIINEFRFNNFLSTSFTNINSVFQFYYLNNLWNDINIALKKKLKIVHFATEPLMAKDIYKKFLKRNMRSNIAKLYKGNMVTRHSKLWGLNNGYIQNKKQVLDNLKKYFNNENFNI